MFIEQERVTCDLIKHRWHDFKCDATSSLSVTRSVREYMGNLFIPVSKAMFYVSSDHDVRQFISRSFGWAGVIVTQHFRVVFLLIHLKYCHEAANCSSENPVFSTSSHWTADVTPSHPEQINLCVPWSLCECERDEALEGDRGSFISRLIIVEMRDRRKECQEMEINRFPIQSPDQ